MANRYYTLMFIPDQTTQVKKVLLPVRVMKGILIGAGVAVLLAALSFFFTLRYFHEAGQFRLAVSKSQRMESELQQLQNRLSSSEQTLLRVRNLEQKLRVILQAGDVSQASAASGIGPISRNDEDAYNADAPGQLGGPAGGAFAEGQSEGANYRVSDLQNRAILQEQSLQELYELLQDQRSLLDATPSVWPTRGWVTSRFGYRVSPFTGTSQFHEGLDIADNPGTSVRAPANGLVVSVETHEGFGKVVTIDHGYGLISRYAHCSETFVKAGQRVRRGEVISSVGNTGRSTGPHLHYEVRLNGVPVNPMRYILD